MAIGKVTFQTREHLCSIRPSGDLLVLDSLHYAAEVEGPGDIEIPQEDLDKDELEMARTLVDRMTRDFDPEYYEDKYRVALENVIQATIRGEEPPPVEEKEPEISPKLADALRQSVEQANTRHKEKAKSGGKD